MARHALRNSMLPVVTVIGLSLGTLIGGAILTETIFSLTGVGKTLFDAINARDYTVVQGFTLVIAVGVRRRQPVHRRLLHVPRPEGPGRRDHDGRSILLTRCRSLEPPISPRASSTGPVAAQPRPVARRARARRCGKRSAQVGAVLLLLLVIMAVFAPLIAPYGPNEVLLGTGVKVREPPCIHLFGCAESTSRSTSWASTATAATSSAAHRLSARASRCWPGSPPSPSRMVIGTLIGLHRRLLRAMVGQRAHAMHGRAAGVPRPAAGHHHRHRARPRAC